MKIRITEPGWATFTGHLGSVEFAEGVSVDDVPRAEAMHLAGIVAIETEEGKNPSASQVIIDSQVTEAVVEPKVEFLEEKPVVTEHTAESLAEAADKGGIKAVRAIAEPMGIKGNSIAELIEKVLAFQAAAAKKAAEEAAKPADQA